MTDEEWMAANPGVGSCDAPGTYTGDRIEELEEEVTRLRRMLGYTDATDDERSRFGAIQVRLDEWERMREIKEAAQEYRKANLNSMQTKVYGYELLSHDEKVAATKLDTLLAKGETTNG